MGQPVKVSDTLAELAREEAEVSHRSMAAQIEHWAALGRAAEKLLDHEQVAALKRLGGGAVASTGATAKERVERALMRVTEGSDRDAILARVRTGGLPTYGTDDEGRLVRTDPDGTRTVGRVVDGAFVAEPAPRKKRR